MQLDGAHADLETVNRLKNDYAFCQAMGGFNKGFCNVSNKGGSQS